ncbi:MULTISPECIES: cobalamin biosynthesis protein [unclassified Mameliella]|uniref:cobalamin biosynthesis protein n=1 Tax=unclassified Mameliella TaxID=2630630 RepID=UPI00273DFA93|nr:MULTISPECIES: cobalamin biosynthesis protein [unclassified Mameliella]
MIVAGFGFRSAVSVQALAEALSLAGSGQTVSALATAADKATSPAFAAFARQVGLPVIGIDAATLSAQEVQTQSEASTAARGTGSLAEAAALAAAGPGARLIGRRVVSTDRMATCALAEGEGA